jgi:hypothetical protein
MNIEPKGNEIYAKRSVNIGDVSIEINIMYPDKIIYWFNESLPILYG